MVGSEIPGLYRLEGKALAVPGKHGTRTQAAKKMAGWLGQC